MAAKSQPRLLPSLLQKYQYSGTVLVVLYNWPIFTGALLFGLVALATVPFFSVPWNWILLLAGVVTLVLIINIIVVSFIVYDWGTKREYERLVELGDLSKANVVIDITCGKLRGTRGLLAQLHQGHYFVVDIYDPQKMKDAALRRAREMESPLEVGRRIYRRTAGPDSLPIPQNWADVVYCSFSLHELQNAQDREAIFAEFARILKPGGKLLIAEHGRDWLNFLAFGLGVFSFYSPASWAKQIAQAGLTVTHHERWRGFVHLWVAEKKVR